MRRVFLLLLAGFACAISFAQELVLPDVLVTGDRALAIHDPILILGQKLTNISISDDGRYVVIVRETPVTGQGFSVSLYLRRHAPTSLCGTAGWAL